MAASPSVFISYSWDDASHRKWVRDLASRLVLNGVRVWLDEWHVRAGDSLTAFMEKRIATSGHVVVICTPNYAKRANSRRGGVGYEQQIISGRIAAGISRRKFIPILRRGSLNPGQTSAIPTHFAGTYVIDMTTPQRAARNFEELLRAIYRVPKFVPPARGAPLWQAGKRKSVRLATAEAEGWWLASGVARNELYPKTFEIPSERARNGIEAGDLVKLAFETDLEEDGFGGERMWVRVADVNGPYFIGKISNDPVVVPLKFGSPVAFLPEHIISIVPAEDAPVFEPAIRRKRATTKKVKPRPKK
ncbi:TIR domain-containing protein [Tardiphaga sp. 37S4]|uniref:TIR domain-containing protein n=1 Tax=Tardiphaga sp. 37S4 TaxID=1404741 RepID=UPI0039C9F127